MYSAKEKAEIISKAQLRLNEGVSLSSIAEELHITKSTLSEWLKSNKNEQNRTEDKRTRDEKAEDFLEKMKKDQEKIIELAAKRVIETISEANPQVAANVLNTATNNYRVSVGKASEIVEVRDWSSFIEDLKKGKVDNG